eukprot:gene37342-biopygen24655
MDPKIVPRAIDTVAGQHLEAVARERRLGADTGEVARGDMIVQHRAQLVLRAVLPAEQGGGQVGHGERTNNARRTFPRITLIQGKSDGADGATERSIRVARSVAMPSPAIPTLSA